MHYIYLFGNGSWMLWQGDWASFLFILASAFFCFCFVWIAFDEVVCVQCFLPPPPPPKLIRKSMLANGG